MFLRQDTVVSALPEFEDEKTRTLGPSPAPKAPKAPATPAQRAVAALSQPVPQLPPQWGSAPAKRTSASPPLAPLPRKPAEPKKPDFKLPMADFEPSVIEQMPVQLRALAAATPGPAPAAHTPHPTPHTQTPTPAPTPQPRGKVLAFFACRGGAGATSLAVNTAAQLARAGRSVCIVDLDLQMGDVFVALDLDAQATSLAALAREASTIDPAALRRRLARHDSGLYALGQTGHLDDIDSQLVERMPALLSTLADQFEYIVVDGIRDFGDYALAVLDMADQVAMVMTQDVASVRRAGRAIQLFRRLGYGDAKLKLVLNRTARGARVDAGEVTRSLKLPVAAEVRNDWKKMRGAFDEGALVGDVARGSGVARDLTHLADLMAGPRASTPPARKRGWFGRGGK
ncbi:MAG TPA: AAA family ATPase [Kofleriaceae bacterium]|nr:AAA family ATPase [Kofleriaceae bacterium]